MNKRFAVAKIKFFEMELEQKIVEADDWKTALETAFPKTVEKFFDDTEDMKDAQDQAVNQDWLFVCTSIEDKKGE